VRTEEYIYVVYELLENKTRWVPKCYTGTHKKFLSHFIGVKGYMCKHRKRAFLDKPR